MNQIWKSLGCIFNAIKPFVRYENYIHFHFFFNNYMNIREINVMRVIITILKYVIKMVRKTIEYSISNKFARGKVI